MHFNRLFTSLVVSAAICLVACSGSGSGSEEGASSDEPTATATSEALSDGNARWCITHTFGYRYLGADRSLNGGHEWTFNVYSYSGQYEGGAAAWDSGGCPHGIAVSANAWGAVHPARCCAQ
jgi:hypothetical protein